MKWGKYLSENSISQWKEYYIHYKALKKFIGSVELNVGLGVSERDEKYFIAEVEENVRKIENWFLTVRNKCFERFELVQDNLPKEIKQKIPCISEFTSFQQYRPSKKKNKHKSPSKTTKNNNKKQLKLSSSKSKKSRDHHDPNKSDNNSNDTTSSTSHTSGGLVAVAAGISLPTSGPPSGPSPVAIEMKSKERERVHVIDIGAQSKSNMHLQRLLTSSDDYNDDDSDEMKYDNDDNDGDNDDDDNDNDDFDEIEFNAKYLRRDIDGNIIKPPTTLFIENAVFSHLPPSQHRECLSILLTLGKLKLYAWQNSEGVRKIIKKFDKRFSSRLTATLLPKIKLNEFYQETKTNSYIDQVAHTLQTRTIPFGHLDVNDLREKGVNLKQMADSIQQLEAVVDANLREIIPMNVEPRSYMANERTFLKWMRMSALTVLVGMILLSMHHEPVTGILLILLSITVLIRSYHEYYKRNEVLVNRIEYDWVDRIGPKLLVLSLFLPMTTYLVYLIVFGSTTNIFHK